MSGTSFSYTWNNAFLSQPADTEDVSLGPQRIRATKAAVGERLAVDHSLAGNDFDGYHLKVTLLTLSTIPGASAGSGLLYTSVVNSNNELFFQDSAGNQVQLTSTGAINTADFIASGTNMLFLQAAVPANWTLYTALNDCVLRVNNSVGGGVGGSWTISGATIGGTSITQANLPNITLSVNVPIYLINSGGVSSNWATGGDDHAYYQLQSVGTAPLGGSGTPHAHSFTNDASWRPSYVDCVIGTYTP